MERATIAVRNNFIKTRSEEITDYAKLNKNYDTLSTHSFMTKQTHVICNFYFHGNQKMYA